MLDYIYNMALPPLVAVALLLPLNAMGQPDPWRYVSEQTKERVLAERRAARAEYPAYFAEAYSRYSQIPEGVLEALAYDTTRWNHRPPNGVMGLAAGGGDYDQLAEAAVLLGVDRDAVSADPRLNILGSAALLAREIDRHASPVVTAEDMAPVLASYTYAGLGLPQQQAGQRAIDEYLPASLAYTVLLWLDRGVDEPEQGIKIPEQSINWERAFEPEMLDMQRSPRIQLEGGRIGIPAGPSCNQGPGNICCAASGSNSDDEDVSWWCPAATGNFRVGRRDHTVRGVTIHTINPFPRHPENPGDSGFSPYVSAINTFATNGVEVSAHYIIRSADGQIAQAVREEDAAYHVGRHNNYTIGIEHDGWVFAGDQWYTEEMYVASADLIQRQCERYKDLQCHDIYPGPADMGPHHLLDEDSNIVECPYDAGNTGPEACGDSSPLVTGTAILGHQFYSGYTGWKSDPGIHWDWEYYGNALNGGDDDPPPPPGGPCL